MKLNDCCTRHGSGGHAWWPQWSVQWPPWSFLLWMQHFPCSLLPMPILMRRVSIDKLFSEIKWQLWDTSKKMNGTWWIEITIMYSYYNCGYSFSFVLKVLKWTLVNIHLWLNTNHKTTLTGVNSAIKQNEIKIILWMVILKPSEW